MSRTPHSTLADPDQIIANLQRQLAECKAELDQRTAERDALQRELVASGEHHIATAEVLQVINSSPGDLAPVFDAMLQKALGLCGAAFGQLVTFDGAVFRAAAWRGYKPGPSATTPTPGMALYQLVHGEQIVHIPDITADDVYRSGNAVRRVLADKYGGRTAIWVALRKDSALLGAFVIYRTEVRPFTDKQIALLQNFAAQAVIAMENAQLITETRESLEQQTATAEVLQVINSSPGDLAPVFDAMLENATRLCEAPFGILRTWDGERFHLGAVRGEPRFSDWARRRGPFRPDRDDSPLGRIVEGERFVCFADAPGDEGYWTSVGFREMAEASGIRSAVTVALRKDDSLLGTITVYRQEVRPFTDKQIALLQNFAAQAVIAMENARLINETREALEQQTATAEVLQVINSSPGDLAPVFDGVLDKAMRLCDAAFGGLFVRDGEHFRAVATRGVPDPLIDFTRAGFTIHSGRLLRGDAIVHFADLRQAPLDRYPELAGPVELGGARTMLNAALRKDATLLGFVSLFRQEVRPFSDKQIALLENFAAQAVIAMENARLLTETHEALEQQTATAEVLGVINSSPGDLVPVFDAMLDKAMRLCNAAFGYLMTYDGERFQEVAHQGLPPRFAEYLPRMDQPSSSGAYARIKGGAPLVHIADLMEGDVYRTSPLRQALVDLGGARTGIVIALRKDETLLGVLTIYRQEVRPFSDKQIALLENFAAQAVIAMENARLITETREALGQQTATAEVLQVINSSPGDLVPVFDAMLDKATRLCEASFGTLWTYDGECMQAVAVQGSSAQYTEFLKRGPHRPSPVQRRLIRGERVVQVADVAAGEGYRSGDPLARALVELGRIRSLLAVPLRKDDALLGAISVYRQEVRAFSDKQIALLQNFAAQAVIAMENARLITETREALEQQTATAEVLGVINSSPGNLQPVFDAMLQKALSLCEAVFGGLFIRDGERFYAAATIGLSVEFDDFVRKPFVPAPDSIFRQALRGEWVVHIPDVTQLSTADNPQRKALIEVGGARTQLQVALRKDGVVLGVFNIFRQEVRPFSDKQIALLQNFAAQAVIAMDNVRLITELRESLEYQTATSDVLRVVSRSTFDLETVLQAVVTTAIRLCRADSAVIYRNDDGEYRWAVGHMLSPEYERIEREVRILPGTGTVVGRAALEGATVQILDAWTDPLYEAKDDARVGGVHTMIGVPLLREGAPIGVIGLARRRVDAFSGREIQLVTTFADQAVIAIENARLLNDLQGRTRDLQESLEYQTATSDVLKIISRSGADLEPVLKTLVETAARVCEADMGQIYRVHDSAARMAASFGSTAEFDELLTRSPIPAGRRTLVGRTMLERRVVFIEDAASDPEYWTEAQQRGRIRTALGVPLLRENALTGVICLARSRIEAFTEKQIALVTTFADQAVIAIENARLFNELRARTAELGRSVGELQMLSEVGQAVSSTLDLRAVLSTILSRSVALAGADSGAIFRYNRAERSFRLVEAIGWDATLTAAVGDLRIPEAETAMGEAAARRMPMQLADLTDRPSAPLRDASLAAGIRGVLIVPLVGPERILGALILQRRATGEFPAETVQLMQTLASQSVLAIQNARLFREIADKSEQLALASQHKSQFLANMSHELRTPLNAILGYAELLVDGIYGQLPDRPRGVLDRIQNNGKHLLALINDVLDLAKIEAGQLTLTLEDYSLPEVVQSVVTATEPLAASKGLNFTAAVQDGLPMAHGDARRVSQVLLNLVGNAIKFTDKGEVEIRAIMVKGQFVLTVRDTGPGIADADQERIFGEFQQIDNTNTRKKGGTGLGLAISKGMVEMQGGTIAVESVLGKGSTFRVVLPVYVDEVLEEAA